MFELLKACTGFLTPIFLVLSPVLSYSDQAMSMHRNKTSAGFSLDIPLIMLVASLMRFGPPARPSVPESSQGGGKREGKAFLIRRITRLSAWV